MSTIDHSHSTYRKVAARYKRRLMRDGEVTCHICNREIDMTLPPSTRDSFSVDHIIPVSRGGDFLDTENYRPAHHGCNAAKKDSLTYEHPTVRTSREW